MKTAKYKIGYNHTSTALAGSKAEAMARVQTQANIVRGAHGGGKLVTVSVDDGDYIYLSQEDADRDDTGARAFAVISISKNEE